MNFFKCECGNPVKTTYCTRQEGKCYYDTECFSCGAKDQFSVLDKDVLAFVNTEEFLESNALENKKKTLKDLWA